MVYHSLLLLIGSLLAANAPQDSSLTLTSPAFVSGKSIPVQYTCDGANISPPVQWSNVPKGTQSFTLILDDPDAPSKTWIHWVLFNIPANQRKLEPHVPAQKKLQTGATHGVNDFGDMAYGGPCPPHGAHQYVMKLYALDTQLGLKPGATKKEVLAAMKGHVLDKAVLKAKYKRK